MSFTVQLQPSGKRFTVEPGESVLDAALRQDIALPYGCRNGGCGTCAARLLSGAVDYPDGLPPALTEAEAATGRVILCQARPREDLVIEAHEVASETIRIKRLPARVVTLRKLAHDVMLMELKLPDSERLQFLPGQYIEILLRDGRRRAFSLANPPHDDAVLQLHIREVPGGYFTHHVFHEMRERALLRIEGPFGSFYLREDSPRPRLMVAGGTGFAPVKAMIEHSIHHGHTQPIHFYWGVRAKRDLYMDELARRWAAEHTHIHYTPVLSEPRPEDDWQGETGFVHEVAARDFPDMSGLDAYLCGPPPMVEAANALFQQQGSPAERIYYDSFEFSADAQAALAEKDGDGAD